MKLFQKKKEPSIKTQLRQGERHPFTALGGYVPLSDGEIKIYRAIREAVPVVDAAILKLIRLTGGFSVTCNSTKAELELTDFLKNVNTGRGTKGIDAFLDAYLDSMITGGRAVGEIVLRGNREIAAILCGNVADICIKEGKTPLDFQICGKESFTPKPLPYQELLLFTPFNPDADNPYGASILRSMPFLADILMKIYNSIGINWERCGNIRYAVLMKPSGDMFDRAGANDRAETVAKEWSRAMQDSKNGSVRDFVAVGDVDIKVIGSDNQILDSQVPVRQIVEQLIARTGIPPFMLGLNWSSTERMSAQQADLMNSEISAIRRSLEPVILKICSVFLRMRGYADKVNIEWKHVDLQDAVELSRAKLLNAQADALIEEEV